MRSDLNPLRRACLRRRRVFSMATLLAVAAVVPTVRVDPNGEAAAAPRPLSATGETTAAETLGWTNLAHEDQFEGTEIRDAWSLYDGPGHAGRGVRSPEAIRVHDGILTITGDEDGTSGGMGWTFGQWYGRWEVRARFPEGAASYHPVLILWPDAEDFPVGGEIDYAEVFDPARQKVNFFLHYGEDNRQHLARRVMDLTTWHHYAVEWTPDHVSGYIDGERWFHSEDPVAIPPRAMHQTIQLDWFPEDGPTTKSTMDIDWIRQYSL